MAIRIQLLGGLRVVAESGELTRFRTQKTAALLGYLARYKRRSFTREQLADLLWPDSDAEHARHNLRMALSSLRKQLESLGETEGQLLQADRLQVRLDPSQFETDVEAFEHALAAAGRAAGRAAQTNWLARAAEAYGGPFLPEIGDEWAWNEQQRLADAYRSCLSRLADAYEAIGDLHGAIAYAKRAVAADPHEEEGHLKLMALYGRTGAPGQALAQFDSLARALRELGLEPSHQARQARDRVTSHPRTSPTAAASGPASPVAGVVTYVAMRTASPPRRGTLEASSARHGGVISGTYGDSHLAVFPRPSAALEFALEVAASHPELSVGLDTAEMPGTEAEVEGGRGEGPSLALELAQAGHPGQSLCSERTRMLIPARTWERVATRDLGVFLLGLPPEPVRVFQFSPEPIPPFAPLAARPLALGYVPMSLTRFFDRERELARLRSSILEGDSRLVTLVGLPGIGKSRIALEFARQAFDQLSGCAWYVPLADRSTPLDLIRTIAAAVGVPEASDDPMGELARSLGGTDVLVVLDGADRILGLGLEPLRRMLEALPRLRVVCTSRQALGLPGEQRLTVEPLPLSPEGNSPALDLFVNRAQLAQPDFHLWEGNREKVLRICRRLDGVPLAIELAAARVATWSLDDLEENLEAAMRSLAARRPGILPRHGSIPGALEMSFAELPDDTRSVLSGFAVFRGGWTLEMAQQVLGRADLEPVLEELLETSWIVLVPGRSNGRQRRFGMYLVVREFLLERTDPQRARQMREAHAQVFAELAVAAEEGLGGPEHGEWLDTLDVEMENLKAALQYASESDVDAGLRIVGGLASYWTSRGLLAEGLAATRKVLAAGGGSPDLRLNALRTQGILAAMHGALADAESAFDEMASAARAAGDRQMAAIAAMSLGNLALNAGDPDEAACRYEEALRENSEEPRMEFNARANLGLALVQAGRLEAAEVELRRVHDSPYAAQYPRGRATVLSMLGELHAAQGRHDEAGAAFRSGLDLASELGETGLVADFLLNLGVWHANGNEWAEAERVLEEAREQYEASERPSFLIEATAELGRVAVATGRTERAAVYLKECLTRLRDLPGVPEAASTLLLAADLALALGAVDAADEAAGAVARAYADAGADVPPLAHRRLDQLQARIEQASRAGAENPRPNCPEVEEALREARSRGWI
jgi:predicted ATPase/DNA-binding SARP family transcriptional activator/TolA-binding protein